MLTLLARIAEARDYQHPADRLADALAGAGKLDPELRRLQVLTLLGGEGDITTAESG